MSKEKNHIINYNFLFTPDLGHWCHLNDECMSILKRIVTGSESFTIARLSFNFRMSSTTEIIILEMCSDYTKVSEQREGEGDREGERKRARKNDDSVVLDRAITYLFK